MVRRVGQEIGSCLVEERRLSAVALRKDDFIEEFDGWIVCARAFSLVDELVEA
jgi:hypothetical protein